MEEFWRKKRTHQTYDGVKEYYYCNLDRKNCNMTAYLWYNNTNDEVELFISDGEHHHCENKKGIPSIVKEKIDKLYKSGLTKPCLIMRSLQDEGINCLKSSQLKNFLQNYKNKTFGRAKFSLSI